MKFFFSSIYKYPLKTWVAGVLFLTSLSLSAHFIKSLHKELTKLQGIKRRYLWEKLEFHQTRKLICLMDFLSVNVSDPQPPRIISMLVDMWVALYFYLLLLLIFHFTLCIFTINIRILSFFFSLFNQAWFYFLSLIVPLLPFEGVFVSTIIQFEKSLGVLRIKCFYFELIWGRIAISTGWSKKNFGRLSALWDRINSWTTLKILLLDRG